jgi:hypothetical protein
MAGFTIPNTPDAYNQNQAEPDSLDFQILGNHGNAVVSGCEVTPGPSGATVAVSAGEVIVNGVHYPVSASVSLSLTAYASSPFFDIVVGRLASGTVSLVVLPGTSGANPVYPTITNNDVVLAAVWRPANTTPTTAMIVDKRLLVPTTTNRVSSGSPSAGTGANGETHVNSSWTANNTLAGPLSVKVGGTWYQVARYSSDFTAGTVTATSFVGALTGNASTATYATSAGSATTATTATTANGVAWSNVSGKPTFSVSASADSVPQRDGGGSLYTAGLYMGNGDFRAPWTAPGYSFLRTFDSTPEDVIVRFPMNSPVYSRVTSGRQVLVDSNNWIGTSASSERYKENISAVSTSLETILSLVPITYQYKQEVVDEDSERPTELGLIAENVAELGIEELLFRDKEGRPDAVAYDRLAVLLLKVCRDQQERITELSDRLDALEAQ